MLQGESLRPMKAGSNYLPFALCVISVDMVYSMIDLDIKIEGA